MQYDKLNQKIQFRVVGGQHDTNFALLDEEIIKTFTLTRFLLMKKYEFNDKNHSDKQGDRKRKFLSAVTISAHEPLSSYFQHGGQKCILESAS